MSASKHTSASFWDTRYANYSAFEGEASPLLRMHFKFHTINHQNGSALDIGSGLGNNAKYLAEQGYAVTALDISKDACQKVAAAATDELLQIVTKATHFEAYHTDNQYDMVICLNVMHLLQPDIIPLYIERMKSLTKQGGDVLIRTYNRSNPNPHPGLMSLDELLPYFEGWEHLYACEAVLENAEKNKNVTDIVARRRD